MRKEHSIGLLLAVVLLITTPRTFGNIIGLDDLALWSGNNLGLGDNVTVNAPIAGGGEVSTGSGVRLYSVYSEDQIWLGKGAVVRGDVIANKAAEAAGNLDFQGNWVGKSVYFGSDAKVTGNVTARANNIDISSGAQIAGNVRGNKHVSINKNSTISGDARPGIGSKLWTGSNVTITGSTDPGSFTADTFVLPSLYDEPGGSTIGTEDIYGGKNSVTTLLPGSYRNLGFEKNATLSFSAGDYTLKNFWMNYNGTVSVDTTAGDVTLNVYGSFDTGKNVAFENSGTGVLTINVFDNNVWLGDGNQMDAAVRVYGGNFGVGKNTSLTGTFYATNNIWLGDGTQVCYNPTTIPEPGTVLLLGLGVMMLRGRFQRFL